MAVIVGMEMKIKSGKLYSASLKVGARVQENELSYSPTWRLIPPLILIYTCEIALIHQRKWGIIRLSAEKCEGKGILCESTNARLGRSLPITFKSY